jgi:hypothetical protein
MIAICDDAAVCGYIELLICIGIGTSESDVDEEITKGPVVKSGSINGYFPSYSVDVS